MPYAIQPTPRPDARADGPLALVDQVIRHSPIGIAVIDHDGCYLDVNPAYCRLYGYERGELLGQRFTVIFAPTQQLEMLAAHRAFLDQGVAFKGEFEVLRRGGQPLAVLAESTRLPGADGRPWRLVYLVDITARRQSEQALQTSQRFLNSVLDGLAAHVCVLDEHGIILAVNRAWREFAQANGAQGAVDVGASYTEVCERAAATGPPALGVVADTTDAADAAEVSRFGALLREVLAGRKQQFQLDYPCHSADEQRWFVARVARIAGSDPVRVVVAHDNVTALKLAQETLRRSEALLLDLAASIPGAMFRLEQGRGKGWRFSYFSPGIQALFGLTPEQACGDIHALGRCILAEDKAEHDRSIEQAVSRGSGWEHEYRIRSVDGRVKWVHAHASPKPAGGDVMLWTGMLSDVSERKRMEAVLKASEEKYRTLFETVPQGVVYHDASGRITSANPAAQRILGLTLEQLMGLQSIDPRWQALREDGSDFPGVEHPAMVALRTGAPVKDVLMGVAVPDRGRAWLLVNATPLWRNGALDQVHATFEDITERVLLSRELHRQASTDYLTGVANRRSLMDRLQIEFERSRRHPALRCSVLSIDLDHFKHINDQWGHATGDAVLQHVAGLMQQITRHNDLVARSGGEEFTLLLPDTGPEEALALAERLRERVERLPALIDGRPVAITISVGVSLVLAADANLDDVLARADQALYQAKNAGRNAVRSLGG